MKKLALIAPVCVLVLAGCAHDPTIAARVAGQDIPISDVTTLVDFMCASSQVAAQQNSPQQAVPMAVVNEKAMTYLAGAKALEALLRENKSSIPAVASVDAGSALALLPASERQRAQQLIDEVNAAFDFVAQKTNATESSQVMGVFVQAVQAEASKGEFSDNPAYPIVSGASGITSGSLSQAVSGSAAASVAASPTGSYVTGLPSSQKCG